MARGVLGVLAWAVAFTGVASAQQEGGPDAPLPADVVRPIHVIEASVQPIEAPPSTLRVTETATETRVDMASDILFDFDRAELRPEAEVALRELSELIRSRARGTVRIEGHTDSKGSDAYNQRLSESRAQTVEIWLLRNAALPGVDYETRGFGSSRPVAPNTRSDGGDSPEGRQKNRRVEVVIERNG